MAQTGDLIDFSIIESHKENIQPLASGRSAKALVSTLASTPLCFNNTPNATRNLNDSIREEYEREILSSQDSDDPLDVYDRYVKWTLSAYPSAQASPESQLRPLLERATKTFQSTAQYKNDPRYLKLWLHYIQFFADAPRETYAYLARHSVGESLALFYEEFSAWLETACRWKQAEEVFKLGLEREARPTERLMRKFGEFQKRYEARTVDSNEPSSPALPAIRPALAAKLDPFSLSTSTPVDPQAPKPSAGIGGSSGQRGSKQKLAVFSDVDSQPPINLDEEKQVSKGWENIGSIAERRKENKVEARPWAGETMKSDVRATAPAKMMIFKDESLPRIPITKPSVPCEILDRPRIVNARTGRVECVFVDLDSVYPNKADQDDEWSFEELRAKARGWSDRVWSTRSRRDSELQPQITVKEAHASHLPEEFVQRDLDDMENKPYEVRGQVETTIAINIDADGKISRPKKPKTKGASETQTIKTNLDSPSRPRMKRKSSVEPTMTLHTRAATDDIIDIFNQPLRNVDVLDAGESEYETDYDEDDYTSAGDSTGTGIAVASGSEFGDTDHQLGGTEAVDTIGNSVSPWSDFTASKHVPYIDLEETKDLMEQVPIHSNITDTSGEILCTSTSERTYELGTPLKIVTSTESISKSRYVPLPPDNYESPVRYVRDPEAIAQSRLPFMTPIAERTETSFGALTLRNAQSGKAIKTPSNTKIDRMDPEILTSSPFQEIVGDSRQSPPTETRPQKAQFEEAVKGFGVIPDKQCNPIDDSIRRDILDCIEPPISSYKGYHDYRQEEFRKSCEIRKFVKSMAKKSSDKTTSQVYLPPVLKFKGQQNPIYTIKRELGKGAFAPVYLAEETSDGGAPETEGDMVDLVAIKCEEPPSVWEFYMMSSLHTRISSQQRASASLLRARSMHLYKDEGYLIEDYSDQGTLLDLVNLARSDPNSTGQATLDESVVMFFTIELLRTVEAMHSVGILHGDLKADNCMVRLLSPSCPSCAIESKSGTTATSRHHDHSNLMQASSSADDPAWSADYQADGTHGWACKGLRLIDFGRGIDLRAFRPDVQFIADWKADKQDCVEIREMRPWTWQIDYHGIAAIVHSMLYGKYIEDTCTSSATCAPDTTGAERKHYRIREPLKRYWQTDLWTPLFDMLLNPAIYGRSKVLTEVRDEIVSPLHEPLQKLRLEMESWLGGEGGRRNGGLKANLARLETRLRESLKRGKAS